MDERELNRLKQNDSIAQDIWNALQMGSTGLRGMPTFVRRCLEGECWRRRYSVPLKQVIELPTFEAFITTAPPEGMGSTLTQIKSLCHEHMDVLAMVDEAVRRPHGGARLDSKNDNIKLASTPTGTSRDAALRRLRKDRPELYQAVIAGKKSPHAAMVEAGFRPRTVNLPTDPGKMAGRIVKTVGREQAELVAREILRRTSED
jgi:hypothetical protein